MKTRLEPQVGYVILNVPEEKPTVSASGLYVPETAQENANMLLTTVYASGGSDKELSIFIEEGDTVATFKNKAMKFTHEGQELILVRYEDILFTVVEENA